MASDEEDPRHRAESIASSTSGDTPSDMKPPYAQWKLIVLGMAWIGVQASGARGGAGASRVTSR